MKDGARTGMSLKAKLEAVIYAAEEPVTLAQLALLFTEEALSWKAEQEAAALEAAKDEAGEQQPVNAELEYPQAEAHTDGESGADGGSEAGSAEAVSESSTGEAGAEDTATAEAAEKKLARQRDREVRGILKQHLDELIASYACDDRGIEIREIAGGYRMATKPECHDVVRAFVKSLKPALKLSLPALETLAVVAYKQPVTAPEVNEIRGVDSSGVFGSLLARKLIATAGRKQVIGRPILYKTTREFLMRFGLKDVSELPSMEEFEKMAAIELDDTESGDSSSAAEVETANEVSAELSLELDNEASQEPGDEAVAMTAQNDTTSPDSVPGGTERAKD
jgi:segregation and condensation protein B